MKQKNFYFLIVLFTVIYVYMTNLDNIPEKIVLFQNEKYEINHLKGIDIKGNKISIADKIWSKLAKVDSDTTGKSSLHLSALGGLFEKDIEVSVLPTTKVMIGGDTVGIRLYSKGVLVIGESPVQGVDGNYYEPYKTTNIQKGDKILKINGQDTETIFELTEAVSNISGEQESIIIYEKDGKILEEKITPVTSFDDGRKKLRLMGKRWSYGGRNINFLRSKF